MWFINCGSEKSNKLIFRSNHNNNVNAVVRDVSVKGLGHGSRNFEIKWI